MRANPVDLPPPNCVRNPKVETALESTLYIWASFSATSVFDALALLGCKTSTIICFRDKSRLVKKRRVRSVIESDYRNEHTEPFQYTEDNNQSLHIMQDMERHG